MVPRPLTTMNLDRIRQNSSRTVYRRSDGSAGHSSIEQGLHPSSQRFQLCPVLAEKLRRREFLFSQQRQQQVLSANMPMIEAVRLLSGIPSARFDSLLSGKSSRAGVCFPLSFSNFVWTATSLRTGSYSKLGRSRRIRALSSRRRPKRRCSVSLYAEPKFWAS